MMEALMYLQVRMDGWKFRFVGDCQVSHYQFFRSYLLYAGDEVLPSHIRIIAGLLHSDGQMSHATKGGG